MRAKKFQLELALQGTFSDHQRSLLTRLLRQMQFLEESLAELTGQIEQRLAPYEDLVQRLDGIPGVDRITAWTVLAEIGTDMRVFGDARHLASWAALCPGNRESGGKRMSGKTRKGNPYLRRALCQSAWAAARKQDSQLAALFRRIRARRGEQKSVMAVAHELLTIIFHIVRDGTAYRELGADHYDRQNKSRVTRKLVDRLQRLGYYVTLQEAEAPLPAAAVTDSVRQPAAPEPWPTAVRRRGRPCKCAERGIPCRHGQVPAPIYSAEIPAGSPAATVATL